jgi:GTP-binding protein
LHDARLGERPEIVVVSKAELPDAAEVQRQLSELIGRDVLSMSAVTGQGLDKLLTAIANELAAQRSAGEDQ